MLHIIDASLAFLTDRVSEGTPQMPQSPLPVNGAHALPLRPSPTHTSLPRHSSNTPSSPKTNPPPPMLLWQRASIGSGVLVSLSSHMAQRRSTTGAHRQQSPGCFPPPPNRSAKMDTTRNSGGYRVTHYGSSRTKAGTQHAVSHHMPPTVQPTPNPS